MIKNLRSNMNTDYGRYYHFDQIETLADYQQQVPLSDYPSYKRLLELQTNIGESGILTTEPTRQYLINAKASAYHAQKAICSPIWSASPLRSAVITTCLWPL